MNVTKPRRTRRIHTEDLKRSLTDACNEPGASPDGAGDHKKVASYFAKDLL